MAKMFLVTAGEVFYLPEGIARQYPHATYKTTFGERVLLGVFGIKAALIDLGTGPDWKHTGEFQIWGTQDAEVPYRSFPIEIFREWTGSKFAGWIYRKNWERRARSCDEFMRAATS